MGLYQSYQKVFVTNSPSILAQGQTVDALAVGQIGILDAKTYTAVTAPTYAKNKALYAVWGTPDINTGDFGGAPNENEYSQLIKGKYITRFRAKAAQRGQTPMYTVGWSGDNADTDTLFGNPGESKNLYVKLTGRIIDRLYGTQGLTKVFKTTPAPIGDCDSACATVPCPDLATQIVDQINQDKDFRKFVKTKAIISCSDSPEPDTVACYTYTLTTCDTGDAAALGIVQAQYPDEKVTFLSRDGAFTTYQVVKSAEVAPADFTSSNVFVTDCTSCPAGYTFVAKAKVYQVKTPEGVALATVQGAFTGEVAVTLISESPDFNLWYVTFPTTTADATVQAAATTADYTATFIGVQSGICQQTTPTEIAWVAGPELLRTSKEYTITLADSICGTSRLADLQAAYPDLVIAAVDETGECVHTYSTSVLSNCYAEGCAIEEITFVAPAPFEGANWVEVPVEGNSTECKCGILFETAFFNVETNECSFDAFPYDNDVVHVQISNYNPDFNASPDEKSWAVKQIRQVKYPIGHGAYVRELEKESKGYDRRQRSWEPISREVQGYSFQADPNKYYDQYVLEYIFKFKTAGGWAEDTTQSWHLNFFVPEGQGAAIRNVFNTYLPSAGIDEDGAAA